MVTITTAPGLIGTLSGIKSKKLEYQSYLTKLEEELAESDLVQRIENGKKLLLELNIEEEKTKQHGIDILTRTGINKFEANGIEVKLKQSIGKLIIDDADGLGDYKTEKVTVTINKKQIKEDLKDGVIIDGVHIEKETTLEIKYK